MSEYENYDDFTQSGTDGENDDLALMVNDDSQEETTSKSSLSAVIIMVSAAVFIFLVYVIYFYYFRWRRVNSTHYLSTASREITDSFELTDVDEINDKYSTSKKKRRMGRLVRKTKKNQKRNIDMGGLYMPPQEELPPVEEEEEEDANLSQLGQEHDGALV